MCVKLHTVSKITLCGKLHTVCKFTHCESNYTLWVKWHTVCKMTHSLWNNTLCKKVLSGVLFALIVKKFLSVNFFTLAPLLMLLTNMRYEGHLVEWPMYNLNLHAFRLTNSPQYIVPCLEWKSQKWLFVFNLCWLHSPEPHISGQTSQFVECDVWICTTRGLPWKGLTTNPCSSPNLAKSFLADEILHAHSLTTSRFGKLPAMRTSSFLDKGRPCGILVFFFSMA